MSTVAICGDLFYSADSGFFDSSSIGDAPSADDIWGSKRHCHVAAFVLTTLALFGNCRTDSYCGGNDQATFALAAVASIVTRADVGKLQFSGPIGYFDGFVRLSKVRARKGCPMNMCNA